VFHKLAELLSTTAQVGDIRRFMRTLPGVLSRWASRWQIRPWAPQRIGQDPAERQWRRQECKLHPQRAFPSVRRRWPWAVRASSAEPAHPWSWRTLRRRFVSIKAM